MPTTDAEYEATRIYRLKPAVRTLFLLVAAGCLGCGGYLLPRALAQPWQDSLGVRCGAVGLLLMGVYLALSAFAYRVLLGSEKVTVRGIALTSTMRRDEIRGRRVVRNRSGSSVVLEARAPESKTLAIAHSFAFDDEWTAWIATLPDLDAEETLAHAAVAKTPGELSPVRLALLQRSRSIAISLSILSLAAGLPLWIYRGSLDPTLFRALDVLLAMLPWVAVAVQARWPHRFTLMAGKSDPRPSLIVVLFGAGVCLMASPFDNLQVDSTVSLLLFACLPALGLSTALFRISPPGPRPAVSFLGLFLVSYFYSYSACSQINTQMDVSTPLVYQAQVQTAAEVGGRAGAYRLTIGPWGPAQQIETIDVEGPAFAAVKAGGVLCITAHEGELRAPWHTVSACR